jgi:hypothetical protein
VRLLAGDGTQVPQAYRNGPLDAAPSWRHVTGIGCADVDVVFAEGADHTLRMIDGARQVIPLFGQRGASDPNPEGGHRLGNPQGVCVLGDSVLVADAASHSLKETGLHGQQAPARTLSSDFQQPTDVAAMAPGITFVLDRGSNRVRLVTANGIVDLPHTFAAPTGLAADPRGNVFVADAGNSTVNLLSADPDVLRSPEALRAAWQFRVLAGGQPGYEDGEARQARFNRPEGLALRSNAGESALLVADTGNNVVRKFDLDTGQVTTLAGQPAHPGHPGQAGWVDGDPRSARFDHPTRLAAALDGGIFVVDQRGTAIRRLTASGAEVETWGGRPPRPATAALDESAEQRAQARFLKPMGVAISPADVVYVADGHAIRQILADGAVRTFAGSAAEAGDRDANGLEARFQDPADLGLDQNGNLFVLEPAARRVRMISREGVVSTVYRTPRDLPAGREPHCLAVPPGRTQTFFLGTPSREAGATDIIRFTLAVHGVETQRVATVQHLMALTADRAGNLFVLLRQPDRQVMTLQRYTHGPGPDAAWAMAGPALDFGPDAEAGHALGMPDIHTMAVDSKGDLFLADFANSVIWKARRDLDRIADAVGDWPFVAGLAEASGLRSPLGQPRGLAVTAQDHLVFTFGQAVAMVTGPGTPDSPWTLPRGAAAAAGADRNRPQARPRPAEAGYHALLQQSFKARRGQVEDEDEVQGEGEGLPEAPPPPGPAPAPPAAPVPAPAAPAPAPPPHADRNALLDQIRQGRTLRPVARPAAPAQTGLKFLGLKIKPNSEQQERLQNALQQHAASQNEEEDKAWGDD